ncbi:MAG: DUF86 domain-containing protein [Chloroflexi bacterium]|nr:DUF86 domain-containing protein [Chloroflexota bacterium]
MSSEESRQWKPRIGHILEAIGRIQSYVHGVTFDQFCESSLIVDAVVRNFLIIGEATRYVPENVQRSHFNLPWAEMRAMRNILAHEYDRVDLYLVWDTIQENLPSLPSLLQQVLDTAPE